MSNLIEQMKTELKELTMMGEDAPEPLVAVLDKAITTLEQVEELIPELKKLADPLTQGLYKEMCKRHIEIVKENKKLWQGYNMMCEKYSAAKERIAQLEEQTTSGWEGVAQAIDEVRRARAKGN